MMMSKAKPAARQLNTLIKRFRHEEDGSVIVLTLFLLVLMLIVGGMAVDFMRFESRRSAMQGCIDNAVLAGADLKQTGTNAEIVAIVEDWSAANGCQEHLVGAPTVTGDGEDYRQVSASGNMDVNTYFLRLIGRNELTALAASTAVQGVGNIEVSLVLDLSGSMREEIPNSGGVTRMERLQEAATAFVDALLIPENEDRVSVNLIPYSEHVNVGPELFAQFNVNQEHGFSYCIEFDDTAFASTGIDDSTPLEQAQHFQFNPAYDFNRDGIADNDYTMAQYNARTNADLTFGLNQPVCPQNDYEQIVPMTQDVQLLRDNIALFAPRSGTSMFLGMKWGVALLDPDLNDELVALPSAMRDTAFANRPAAFNSNNAQEGATAKYVILMSDGQNDSSYRLEDWAYDTPSKRAHWAQENYQNFYRTDKHYEDFWGWFGGYDNPRYDADSGDTALAAICAEAKKPENNITIYSIAMGTDSNPAEDARGKAALSNCASGPSFYKETSGDELVAIFEAIADQITELRLTQ